MIELQQAVVGADKALQEFKTANNLVSKGAGSLPIEQIAVLTAKLTATKMQVAEAKARLDRAQEQTSNEEEPGLIFPDNPVIVGLRSKYLDLSRRAAELATRVGPDHFAVVKLHKDMYDARTAIRYEERETWRGLLPSRPDRKQRTCRYDIAIITASEDRRSSSSQT